MTNKLKMLGLAAVMAVAGSAASAVTYTYTPANDPDLDIGDIGKVSMEADPGENWGDSSPLLTFNATTDLRLSGEFTVLPFNEVAPNDIVLSLFVNGSAVAMSATENPAGDPLGSATYNFSGVFVEAGTGVVEITVSGTAGAAGGDIDFSYAVSAVPVPAAGFLLLGGLGALAATRRRKKS